MCIQTLGLPMFSSGIVTRRPLILQLIHLPSEVKMGRSEFDGKCRILSPLT
jgi:hypothetical protein